MKDFYVEELKVCVGAILADIRLHPHTSLEYRFTIVFGLLDMLMLIDTDNEYLYSKDYGVCLQTSMKRQKDFTRLRDECHLYNYYSQTGRSDRVMNYLAERLQNFQLIWFQQWQR